MENFRLQKVARAIVDEFAHAKPGEEVLILADTSIDETISETLWGAVDAAGAKSHVLVMSSAAEFWKPPPKIVQEACFASDVLIRLVGRYDWGYTPFAEELHRHTREAIVDQPTVDSLVRLYDFDVGKMVREVATLCRLYNEHKNVHITSQTGTDFKFRIAEGGVTKDDAMVVKKGDWSFLPGGNPSAVAVAGSGEGKVVFDGTFGGVGIMGPMILTTNMELTVRKGTIAEIAGGAEANEFNQVRELGDPNLFNCPAEFGIGLLNSAWKTDALLIAERVRGAVHVGIGSNLSLPGGTVAAIGHLDGMILKPTVKLDNITVVQDGRIRIDEGL
jgi:leucyl aminopeptidase (aminopeptidase T)